MKGTDADARCCTACEQLPRCGRRGFSAGPTLAQCEEIIPLLPQRLRTLLVENDYDGEAAADKLLEARQAEAQVQARYQESQQEAGWAFRLITLEKSVPMQKVQPAFRNQLSEWRETVWDSADPLQPLPPNELLRSNAERLVELLTNLDDDELNTFEQETKDEALQVLQPLDNVDRADVHNHICACLDAFGVSVPACAAAAWSRPHHQWSLSSHAARSLLQATQDCQAAPGL